MATQVILLNGGSSSGKSGVVRCLQAILPQPWLAFGVDTLIEATPSSMKSAGGTFTSDGQVKTGDAFQKLDAAWSLGIAATARAGVHVIIDEVFISQTAAQDRWRTALYGLDVLWVGVRCESSVAEGRELARGDRVSGMAKAQADLVHQGVSYDLEVDTTMSEAFECARIIASRLN